MATPADRFANSAEKPLFINGLQSRMANPGGIPSFRKIKGLDWQTCSTPVIDSVGLFSELANLPAPESRARMGCSHPVDKRGATTC